MPHLSVSPPVLVPRTFSLRILAGLLTLITLFLGFAALPLRADEAAMLTKRDTLVMVRPGVEPSQGWGGVDAADIGQIAAVAQDGMLSITFADKGINDWKARQNEMMPVLGVGMVVVRGPDWKWQNQDGGDGGRGRVTAIDADGWATVNWDNGTENGYRWNVDGAYDIRPIAFGAHPQVMSDVPAAPAAGNASRVRALGTWTMIEEGTHITFANDQGPVRIQLTQDSNGWFVLDNNSGKYVVYSNLTSEPATDSLPAFQPASEGLLTSITKFGDWTIRVTTGDILVSHVANNFDIRLWNESNGWFDVLFHDGTERTYYSTDAP